MWFKILFLTLQYAMESQIRFHGYDPAKSLITSEPREVRAFSMLEVVWCDHYQGEDILRTEDIVAKIKEEGDSIALVLFSGTYVAWQC